MVETIKIDDRGTIDDCLWAPSTLNFGNAHRVAIMESSIFFHGNFQKLCWRNISSEEADHTIDPEETLPLPN